MTHRFGGRPGLALTCLTMMLMLSGSEAAGIDAAVRANHPVQAELIASAADIQPGRPFWIGVRLRMDENWHVYWMNPGDSGLATAVEWRLPHGITAGELLWPYPQRIETPPLVSFGYEGEAVLLTQMRADATLSPGDVLVIGARVEWLACREECLPGGEELILELPVQAGSPSRNSLLSEEFTAARRKLPQNMPGWKVNARADTEYIRLQIVPPRGFTRAMERMLFFPAMRGLIDLGRVETFRKTDMGYFLEIPRSRLTIRLPSRLAGVLFSDSGWDAEGSLKALWVDAPLHIRK